MGLRPKLWIQRESEINVIYDYCDFLYISLSMSYCSILVIPAKFVFVLYD